MRRAFSRVRSLSGRIHLSFSRVQTSFASCPGVHAWMFSSFARSRTSCSDDVWTRARNRWMHAEDVCTYARDVWMNAYDRCTFAEELCTVAEERCTCARIVCSHAHDGCKHAHDGCTRAEDVFTRAHDGWTHAHDVCTHAYDVWIRAYDVCMRAQDVCMSDRQKPETRNQNPAAPRCCLLVSSFWFLLRDPAARPARRTQKGANAPPHSAGVGRGSESWRRTTGSARRRRTLHIQ